MLSRSRPALPLLLGALVGCSSGSDLDDYAGTVVVTITAVPSSASDGTTIEAARVSLAELGLVSCDPDDGPIAVEDFPIDLFGDPARTAVFDTGVPANCKTRLELAPAALDGPLAGHSVLLGGTREDGARFELESDVQTSFTLATQPPGTAFSTRDLVLGFDLHAWLAAADLDALPADAGVVRISAAENSGALAAFEANTSASAAVYVDGDGDGELAGDELTPVATAE